MDILLTFILIIFALTVGPSIVSFLLVLFGTLVGAFVYVLAAIFSPILYFFSKEAQ